MPVRTLEEIADAAWIKVHTPGEISRDAIHAAVREAVAQERKWFRMEVRQAIDQHPRMSIQEQLIRRLDAREKSE